MNEQEAFEEAFMLLIGATGAKKEMNRMNKFGRRYAIVLTLLEQAYAYYFTHIKNDHNRP